MEDRVKLEVCTSDGLKWGLITSDRSAREFISQWSQTDAQSVLSIKGVLDHRDANIVEYHLQKDTITGMSLMEIKL